ncbi:hypothetical protein OSB04_023222 [Centaurea solstitialis]|uniref:Bet v I/Major latex protein domain-containing protein n=1 Tax=Centaurea solstitialis TaxID=347529 RepID=A0AA38W975_9ASTR|nr:hypothetical protein OSB04_023222 [Centaurea solstitialis]
MLQPKDITINGKKKFSKQIIEAVDETNHQIVFKLIGGELVEIYKTFTITFHVEPKGRKQLATWTFDFEKPNTNVPYPTAMMDYLCEMLADMDVHLNGK